MRKLLDNVAPEKIAVVIMVGICLLALVFAFCLTTRCDNCNNIVNTAFCTKCGLKNDEYIEPVVENVSGLICPVCNVECLNNYCGGCGSEIVFVDNVDAVSGG